MKTTPPPAQIISEFVQQCRRILGESQDAFGERYGCKKPNVSAWESGRHAPSVAEMVNMAELAKLDLPECVAQAARAGLQRMPRQRNSISADAASLALDVSQRHAAFAKLPSHVRGEVFLTLVNLIDGGLRPDCLHSALDQLCKIHENSAARQFHDLLQAAQHATPQGLQAALALLQSHTVFSAAARARIAHFRQAPERLQKAALAALEIAATPAEVSEVELATACQSAEGCAFFDQILGFDIAQVQAKSA
ncbi:helix-turn-helix transcriptional regulator [Massilia sp. W12]|uniref:helix-turn-helix domain-containing protein n=1 Tax=Massilia sp. W12 TaxID=3126507 RepID=UPI0030CAA2CF